LENNQFEEVSVMDSPQWHALQVRPRFERIVALRLRQRHIEQYLPLRKIARNDTHSIEVPLFPGYVFCKDDRLAAALWDIPGALFIVRSTDGINIIPEQQITDLRRILTAGVNVQAWPFTSPGRTVMVEHGPLSGVTGILEERTDRRLLVLSIQVIRRSVALKIDRHTRISFRQGATLPFGIGYMAS
jgi:transcription termination/antitermination protein NusG